MTTFCTVTVLVVVLVLVLRWSWPKVREYFGLDELRTQDDVPNFDFEFFRVEQQKQAAMEDIRRRRQNAEDQLRRLGRWSR